MIQYIQMLRFAAALWVALYHARQWDFFPQLPKVLRIIVDGGYAGVDIFFVISGVIMALVTHNSPAGWRPAATFVLNRFARIYTGWWPVMLMSVVALSALQILPPTSDLLASALLYPSNFTFHVSSVIWTLVYELYFYLLIAASLLLPPRWRDRCLALLALGIAALVAQTWLAGHYAASELHRATYVTWFFAGPIVLEFFAGYFLYRILCRRPPRCWPCWALATVVLGLFAAYFGRKLMAPNTSLAEFYFWTERTLFIGAAACALVGTALCAPPPTSPRWQSLARLGDYSFGIYLLHPLVLQLMHKPTLWLDPQHLHRGWMTNLVILVLLVAAALYYHAIEHPLYQACRRAIARWLAPKT